MSEISVKGFAQKIGVEPDKLLVQLDKAGIGGKSVDDVLGDDEKLALLKFLRGDGEAETPKTRSKITLNKRTTSEIKQTSRTGSSHNVQVVVRKKRTFVRKGIVEEVNAKEVEKAKRAEEEIAARKAEEEAQRKAAEEAARREAEEKVRKEAEKAAEEARNHSGAALKIYIRRPFE